MEAVESQQDIGVTAPYTSNTPHDNETKSLLTLLDDNFEED